MDLSGHEGQIPIPMPNTTYVGGVPYSQQPRRGGGGVVVIRYRECLKNHAVSLGGCATDGCGEFMPSGEEGTLEAYKCSACSCHRNFHRREVVDGAEQQQQQQQLSSSSCESYQQHLKGGRRGLLLTAGPPLVMPLGVLQASSESEEKRKRFRTKFSAEQKEKMLGFAERVGWRLQGLEEGVVQHFCQEIGVKRRVLKIWMHNNKHTLAKKNPPSLTS